MIRKWEEGKNVTRSKVIPGVGRVLLDPSASGGVGVGNNDTTVYADVCYNNGMHHYSVYMEAEAQ